MSRLGQITFWLAFGCLIGFMACGTWFCMLQVQKAKQAPTQVECQSAEQEFCGFFDILIEKSKLGPQG